MTYEDSLTYLDSLGKFGINLGLKRIEQLLHLMDNPERQYKTIHVAGTNGKGSTTAMIAAVLNAAGIRTGMYTSPHLVDYTERIAVSGCHISREQFAQAIQYTKQFVDRMVAEGWEHPTQFEVLTAAAFYHFAAVKAEYAVIEVGLGGLLDSTNVIIPEVAVVTNVTREHTDRCGNTVAEIAGYKAGIIKCGIPVVTAASGDALAVISRTAADKEAPLYILGRHFSGLYQGQERYRQKVAVKTDASGSVCYMLNMLGRHQVDNCAAAVMAVQILAEKDSRITQQAIAEGLGHVRWPGRLEIVSAHPVVIIDGAHNPDGARVLRRSLDELFPGKGITFLLGILRDKDVAEIVTALIRAEDSVVVVAPLSERAGDPEEIASAIRRARHVETAASIEAGLERVQKLCDAAGVVCIAGSLYLIGAARQLLLSRQKERY